MSKSAFYTRSALRTESCRAAENISVVIVPLAAHRDALDLTVAWSTVIASILALIALMIALWAIRHSDRALIRERQNTFELGVLAQLAHACGNLFKGSATEVLALIELLPGELDGLRLEIERRADNGPGFSSNERILANHWAEYKRAVDRRRKYHQHF